MDACFIDFSKSTIDQIADYFGRLDPDTVPILDQHLVRIGLAWHNSSLIHIQDQSAELTDWDLVKLQEVACKIRIWDEYGLTFEEFMSQTFGRDWEDQLRKSRVSATYTNGRDKELQRANKERAAPIAENRSRIDNGLEPLEDVPGFMVAERQHYRGSAPLVSLKIFEPGKDPCSVKLEDGSVISVHKPGLNGIECTRAKSNGYLVPIVRSTESSSSNGDMAGGTLHRKIAITGFCIMTKSARCNGVDHVEISVDGITEYHSVVDWDREFAECLASNQAELETMLHPSHLEMARMSSEELKAISATIQATLAEWMTAVLPDSPLFQYYQQEFPGQNPFQACLKAYSGGTLKMKYVSSLDFCKIAERGIRFTQDAIDDQIRLLAGLIPTKPDSAQRTLWRKRGMLMENPGRYVAEIAAIEESVGHLFPPISDVLRLTWTKAAIKKLTRLSTLNMSEDALRSRLEKICKLSGHTGRLRSKQTKMRTGDKSCKVNGVRVGQLADLFVKIRLTFGLAEPGQDLTEFKASFGEMGFTQPELDRAFRVFGQNLYVNMTVNRVQLEQIMNHPMVGFNWTEYALARIADGSYQPSWTADSKLESIHTGLSRSENRERLAELMMNRLSALSIQQFLDGGGNSWVQMSDGDGRYYNPNMVIVEFQHVKLDSKEFERVVEAWKIVRDAGEDPSQATVELDEVNIVSAMKRPSAWKMLTEIREEFVISQYRA